MNNPKILLVDDDPKITSLLCVILQRAGYEIRQENKSFAAVAAVRQFCPQLIVLDVDMPGKDGGAVAAELLANPATSALPVIFLSSLVTERETGMRGSYTYLAKPVDAAQLLRAVQQRLSTVTA